MRKEIKLLIMAICAIVTIPLLTSCGDDDEPEMEYLKASDWKIETIETFSDRVTLQCDIYRSEWGVYYSTNQEELSNFKQINQIERTDWQKFESLNIKEAHASYDTTRKLYIQELAPNTIYYYVAFYYSFESMGGPFTSVNYTDIKSFTTSDLTNN